MGRKRDTTHADNLRMAKLHFVEGLSYTAIAKEFDIASKNTVSLRIKELKEEYPEFITALQEVRDYEPEPTREISPVVQEIKAVTEANNDIELVDLATKIEEQVHLLLDLSPEQIRAMKSEHRLRHIPNLVKSMRLLRDESTANVKQVSLISCIGIATERRKPQS